MQKCNLWPHTDKIGGFQRGFMLPFGTRPCLQGVVCYTCWPQGYGNGGGARWGKAPSTTGWEKVPGLAGIQSQGRPPNSMVRTRTILSVLPLGFVGLPPGGEGGVFWGEGGFDRLLLKDTRGIIFCPKRFNQKQMIIHT